mgnify:CR=1 FL=1
MGDELLDGVEPEDMYIDDADDSAFQSDFTETGAFAGPGYVEMPQSRVGKFFGKFRRKKKEEEESASEWLGVGDDFDAREVGNGRGAGRASVTKTTIGTAAHFRICVRAFWVRRMDRFRRCGGSGPCVCGSVRCSAFVAGRFGFVRFVRFSV